MHPDWARSLRDQCQRAGISFFFKQWGEWRMRDANDPDDQQRVRLTDKGTDGQDLASGGDNQVWMQRVGKKIAGNLLDGRKWEQYPEPQ